MRNIIRKYGDPILRKKCQLVEEVGSAERNLILRMFTIMREHEGIGLAAPQIGIERQIIVIDTGEELLDLINPQILEERGEDSLTEGCLSLPEIFIPVKRPTRITVEGLDRYGKKVEVKAKDLLARVIQHEVDHLKGILIVDYANEKRMGKVDHLLNDLAHQSKMLIDIKNKSGRLNSTDRRDEKMGGQ